MKISREEMIMLALEDLASAIGKLDIKKSGWWKMQPREFVIYDRFVWPSKLGLGNGYQDWFFISDGHEKYDVLYSGDRHRFARKIVDVYKDNLWEISHVLRRIYAAAVWCLEQAGEEI